MDLGTHLRADLPGLLPAVAGHRRRPLLHPIPGRAGQPRSGGASQRRPGAAGGAGGYRRCGHRSHGLGPAAGGSAGCGGQRAFGMAPGPHLRHIRGAEAPLRPDPLYRCPWHGAGAHQSFRRPGARRRSVAGQVGALLFQRGHGPAPGRHLSLAPGPKYGTGAHRAAAQAHAAFRHPGVRRRRAAAWHPGAQLPGATSAGQFSRGGDSCGGPHPPHGTSGLLVERAAPGGRLGLHAGPPAYLRSALPHRMANHPGWGGGPVRHPGRFVHLHHRVALDRRCSSQPLRLRPGGLARPQGFRGARVEDHRPAAGATSGGQPGAFFRAQLRPLPVPAGAAGPGFLAVGTFPGLSPSGGSPGRV